MITLFLTIAIGNLFVGFGLALALEIVERRAGHSGDRHWALVNGGSGPGGESMVEGAGIDGHGPLSFIPDAWVARLEADGVPTNSFAHAAAMMAQRDLETYRTSLAQFRDGLTRRLAGDNRDSFADILEGIRSATLTWLISQTDMVQEFKLRRPDSTSTREGADLNALLLDQSLQLEIACANLDSLYLEADPTRANEKLSHELERLLEMTGQFEGRESQIASTFGGLVGAGVATERQ